MSSSLLSPQPRPKANNTEPMPTQQPLTDAADSIPSAPLSSSNSHDAEPPDDETSEKHASNSNKGENTPRDVAGEKHVQSTREQYKQHNCDSTEDKTQSDDCPARERSNDDAAEAGDGIIVEDDGWDFQWDATHQAYFFYNRFTGATTWENPRQPLSSASKVAENATKIPTTTTSLKAAEVNGRRTVLAPLPPGAPPQPPTVPLTLLNSAALPPPPTTSLPAGGYNPAIHGDYDPEAWYAKAVEAEQVARLTADEEARQAETVMRLQAAAAKSVGTSAFNRFSAVVPPSSSPVIASLLCSGGVATASATAIGATSLVADSADQRQQHQMLDEARSRRQLNSFFDVDAAANRHDGRSLKAERSGVKPSKKEVKQFKEKRRLKKEERRRAWLKE